MSPPKWLPPVANSFFIPRRRPSCLLPFHDQQMGLTQAPFKLHSLGFDLDCMRFCMSPLTVKSLFPIAFPLS